VLADGGTGFLEVETDGPARLDAWTDFHHVNLDRLSGQLDRYGLRIHESESAHSDATASTVARLTVRRNPL
jgi:hypothetical protein